MKKDGISERDLKALLGLGMILMVALAYFIGFQVFLKNFRETSTINNELQIKVNDLRIKDANKQTYINETDQYHKQIKDLIMQFPSKVTTEKVIFDLDGLRKKLGQMQYDSTTLSMNSIFYPQQQVSSTGDASAVPTKEDGTVAGYEDGTILVYCSEVTLDFQKLSYQSLKKLVEEVHNYDGRLTIDSSDLEFDSETGLLTGTFVFKFYSLEGSPHSYKAPDITGISSGLKNIFGTFDKK